MKIIGIELFIINDSKKLRVSMSKSFEGSSKKVRQDIRIITLKVES